MSDGFSRRKFLKVLGATGGGAVALSGCSGGAAEKLIPYLVPPEDQIPGKATWYASTCRECSAGCGLHVRTREGRAVKVEGNPNSPINQGKLCALGQSSLQGLYNPDRVRAPMERTASGQFQEISWDEAIARVASAVTQQGGDRVWFLTGNEAGSFDALINEWLAALGSSGRVSFEPLGYEALRHANNEVFGLDALPSYDLAAARFVISFGTDFLETWMNPVENARGFTEGHSFADGSMGRYVHVEPRLSMTAFLADEWIAPIPGTEGALALAMAQVVLGEGLGTAPRDARRLSETLAPFTPENASSVTGISADKITTLAREFASGPSVALAGGVGAQHGEAHSTAAAVNILNYVAGNVGQTVKFGPDLNASAGSYQGLLDLVSSMNAGAVGVLFVHGSNPSYSAPGSGFAAALQNVNTKVSFSRFLDETAMDCDLILPDHDPLEQWNDYEPRVGAYALQQPVMRPVFDTRQTGDVVLSVAGSVGVARAGLAVATYKEYLQGRWQQLQRRLRDRRPFETFWLESLQAGGVWTDIPPARVSLAASAVNIAGTVWSAPTGGYTLVAYPSSTMLDGRGANRSWLQELPDPVSKVTWSSWVEMSPHTAETLDIAEGDIVRLESDHGSLEAPAFIYPGIRDDVVAVPMGQGHTEFGQYAKGVGANVSVLLDGAPTVFGGQSHYVAVNVSKTGAHERLAKASGQNRQMGRGMAQATTLAALVGEGHGEEEHRGEHAAPVPEHVQDVLDRWQEDQWEDTRHGNYAGEHPRWGLAIDLSKCTGCSACVTACHAENNIPIVGKEQVARGREMSWIRIERYFEGGHDGEPVEIRLLPMMCQHCGNAPCEPVCPVYATYHTPDGLNAQIYNRCIGTRYCSNNCPYKVRYFNFYDYQNSADPYFSWPEPLHWQLNPDVTVREKGVMEKCTFCVQRIRGAQHQARLEGREVQDGEIQTACQQTCPADAIVFGDLNDPNSRVSQRSHDERGYHVLEGLNTYPGVTYLKKVRNTVAS
ncbi:MAG: molybdopterin-dependent oxidoreductase [Gemmatimonadetes bacterium]|nr:molybdopterin-dependent oxidoreductase [Gemmatimonadota bacterium]